jgi:hypothetical protein
MDGLSSFCTYSASCRLLLMECKTAAAALAALNKSELV